MGFAENLQFYRKKMEITQEQLAEQLGVSRQTISKWEAASSYPEMDKIIQLCDMFGCTMDVLLRGDARESEAEDIAGYDRFMNQFCKRILIGITILLVGISFYLLLASVHFDENIISALYMIFAIPAVLIFIVTGLQRERFCKKYPVIQSFYTEEEIDSFEQRFPILIASGIGIILVGVVFERISEGLPVLRGFTSDIYYSIFMLFVTVGVNVLVYAGLQKEKYNIEAYNKKNQPDKRQKVVDQRIGTWCGCIMMAATVIYLAAGLGFGLWDRAWVVFPIGGILCGIAVIIIQNMTKNEEE